MAVNSGVSTIQYMSDEEFNQLLNGIAGSRIFKEMMESGAEKISPAARRRICLELDKVGVETPSERNIKKRNAALDAIAREVKGRKACMDVERSLCANA